MKNLKIYIDRLKGGQTLAIDESLPPDFLDLHEKDLVFLEPIRLKGEAYLANEHLIIHLNIQTVVRLPCNICNDSVCIPLAVKNIYLTEPLAQIKSAIFDLTGEVRESILLQAPSFAECHSGKCPERANLKQFLKEDIAHFPFADLDKQ